MVPATIADVSERLVALTAAINTRTEAEKEWRALDKAAQEKREDRQHRITLLLIGALLALAGLRVAEYLKLVGP